jgi:hypothetical protein
VIGGWTANLVTGSSGLDVGALVFDLGVLGLGERWGFRRRFRFSPRRWVAAGCSLGVFHIQDASCGRATPV